MRILSLDVGEKRIGVATADTSVKIAVPHSVVQVDGTEFEQIAKLYRLLHVEILVVGLPRNSKGQLTAQSKVVQSFIISLQHYFVKHKLEKPRIKLQDESLTSVLAEQNLKMDKKREIRKGDIDREAATLILQDFLENFREEDYAAKKKHKASSRIFKAFVFLLGLIIVALVAGIAWYYDAIRPVALENDCQKSSSKCITKDFVLKSGESTDSIASRLEDEKLIKSSLAFKAYLKINKKDSALRAGQHQLKSAFSVAEIIRVLEKDTSAATFSVTFLPGDTLSAAKKRLLAVGYSESDIDAAFNKSYDHPLLKTKPQTASLEGYIYGETYEFYSSASVEDVLKRVFDEFYKVIESNKLIAGFESQGLNLHQGITLASIIQRETGNAADQSQVSQVFLSRLKQGIVLGSDAVIGYAADQENPNRNKSDMSYLTTIKCPWNSRQCQGLPPTPIATPGKSALLSVANPSTGSYLYFLTGDDGKMYYAYTEAEHQKNIKSYCKVMCSIL